MSNVDFSHRPMKKTRTSAPSYASDPHSFSSSQYKTYDTTGTGVTQEQLQYAYSVQPGRKLKGVIIDPIVIAKGVYMSGGIDRIVQMRKWQKVRAACDYPLTSSSGNTLYRAWNAYFPEFSSVKRVSWVKCSPRT